MLQSESRRAKILIVDDQKSNLTVLRELLFEQGEIILAKSGAQCLDKAARLQPDLILLDIIMPDMNGFETLEKLHQIKAVADTPVMFITGLKDADHEQKGLMLGALDYIRKPFNPTVVKARVATHLKLAKQNNVLKEMSQKLKAADAAKSLFLANMSHEIRTPLTSIIGYGEMLRTSDIPKEKEEGVVAAICNNGEHLLQLINDILDMSKIEANQLQIEIIDVLLPRWLTNIIDIVAQRAEGKGLEFKVDFKFPLPSRFQSDPTRLQQILLNLLNNAIKFTSSGSVLLEVESAIDRLIFSVSDTGIGINKEQQAHIFDAFAQAEFSTNRKFGGTGLGLNISQHLAKLLGGEISVESTLGKGSKFTVTTRLNPVAENEWLKDKEQWYSKVTEGRESLEWPTLKGRVLVAEDQTEIQQLIRMLLEYSGLEVVTVNNGRDLVDTALENHFDLILTDIQMPGLSGIDALEEMQKYGCLTPTIALTANAMVHQTESYREAGFIDYICKPFSRLQFIQTISTHMVKASEAQRLFEQKIAAEANEIAKVFLDNLPNQMALTEEHFKNGDWKELGEVAHAVKGGALTFGFDSVGKLAADLEQATLQSHHNQEQVMELMRSLHIEAATICDKDMSAPKH